MPADRLTPVGRSRTMNASNAPPSLRKWASRSSGIDARVGATHGDDAEPMLADGAGATAGQHPGPTAAEGAGVTHGDEAEPMLADAAGATAGQHPGLTAADGAGSPAVDDAGSPVAHGSGPTAADQGTMTVLAVAVRSPAGLAIAIAEISTLRSDAQ